LVSEFFAGLDLGGTEIKVGICGVDGVEAWSDRSPSNAASGQNAILTALGEASERAIAAAEDHGGKVLALGLGNPRCG